MEIAKLVKVESFKPQNVQLKENDKDTKEEKAEDDDSIIEALSDEL
jgi:ubiquitin-activating enzyme E1